MSRKEQREALNAEYQKLKRLNQALTARTQRLLEETASMGVVDDEE